jgi:Flp pilus assembly protein TadD
VSAGRRVFALTAALLFPPVCHAQVDRLQPEIAGRDVSAVNEARALRREGDLSGAESILRGVTDKNPGYFNALYLLGLTLSDRDKMPEATKVFEAALKVREVKGLNDDTIYNTVAWAYLIQGNIKRARELLTVSEQRLPQLSPQSQARALNNLGLVYLYEKEWTKAEAYFKRAEGLGSAQAKQNLKLLASAAASSP